MKVKFLEKPDELLDIAFRKARKEASKLKKGRNIPRHKKDMEIRKIEVASNYLIKRLKDSHAEVPDLSQLHPFYQEFLEATIDVGKFKQALGQMRKVTDILRSKIKRESIITVKKIRREDASRAKQESKKAYGRLASVMKSLEKNIEVINDVSYKLRDMPRINFDLPSVILAGFPNTGKTTLLKRLTGADAKIASYAFTTQKIELGYFSQRFREFQIIDTPGLLDRPAEKRNLIEQKAASALRHLANIIVFVVDPTENCGYALEQQLNLLKEIKKQFKAPIVIALNKTDLASKEQIDIAKKELKKYQIIMTGENQDVEELKKAIVQELKDFFSSPK